GGGLAKYDNHVLDNTTKALEGTQTPPPVTGEDDIYAVELATAPEPGTVVFVNINLGDSEAELEVDSSVDPDDANRFFVDQSVTPKSPGKSRVEFDSTNWNAPILLKVKARFDNVAEDPHNTVITHSITLAQTTDPAYAAVDGLGRSVVLEQRLDARIIDDENAGIFQVESGGNTLVSAGSAQEGHGKGDSYTMRLTSAPTSNVEVALITD